MSNKDEALRAKDLAEDWMRKKDFTTARSLAINAREMDASLEDIVSRMIMVCDVHCAVLDKSGDENDWYKILQVEQNADDNTIKKQYKKLALCFHPDKNQLPGAEAAFKVIGEAHSVLSDKYKRMLHDMRRKPVKKPAPPASQRSKPPKAPTTACAPQRAPSYQPPQQAPAERPEIQKKTQTQRTELGGGSRGRQGSREAGKAAEKQPETSAKVSSSKEGISAENNNGKKKIKTGQRRSRDSSSNGKNRTKKAKADQVGRSRDSSSNGKNRTKKAKADQVGRSRDSSSNGKNRTKKAKADQVGRSRDSSSGNASDAEIFECPDPDFTNFEKLREPARFKDGQTWAMYDDMDRMPRLYANIKSVRSNPFMLVIQWLEPKPDDKKAVHWVQNKLPISVGKFKLAAEDHCTNEVPSFSHLIHCDIGRNNDIVRVYPRIGEIWALFKNWDMTWSSRSSHEHVYEYEFVEILSEYSQGVAIKIAFLHKVEGFASVFCRIATGADNEILPHELLRFSHSIPSTKLSGKERDGVPVGSYELDTAALPCTSVLQNYESRRGQSSSIPDFTVEIKAPYSCYLKCDYARVNMPEENTTYKIYNENLKRSWSVEFLCERRDCPRTQPRFSKGWSHLAKEYPITIGDSCTFTHLGPKELRLTISRRSLA